jgi:mannitol/fructose-specific phosphotransferase system IIA component (Ntr-type)
LIRDAQGVTVVVLDTRKPEAIVPFSLEEKIIQEESRPPSISSETGRTSLSHFLSPQSIVIWREPITKDEALRSLTEAVWCENGIDQRLKGLAAVTEREEEGSTFFNEGVAFPHARIEGLSHACVSLGLTHGGLSDVKTEMPIECIFLIFTPAEEPDEQIRILSLASRAAQDRQLMENLQSAATPDAAYAALQNWENVSRNEGPLVHSARTPAVPLTSSRQ